VTQRLYYTDSFLFEFDASVTDVRQIGGRTAIVLDRTAFYPTSGGQPFDTGWFEANGTKLRVVEVAEDESGEILHFVEGADQLQIPRFARDDNSFTRDDKSLTRDDKSLTRDDKSTIVHGCIDLPRRRDHMQQHTGQHVLSAAFLRLFDMPTVSFHMGEESCTIDLVAKSLSDAQVCEAEQLANSVLLEDRQVEIRFASVEQAREMGVRKIPPELTGELRLIDIHDFDLNACGGTHVSRTGQIGVILLRKTEKVKQGIRVEFVCGERAVRAARRDYETLTEAGAIYSAHIYTVPEQIRKSQDEIKAAQKERKRLLEELAELHAARLVAESPMKTAILRPAQDGATSGDVPKICHPERSEGSAFRLLTRILPDRDSAYIKLLAQKAVALSAGPAGREPGAWSFYISGTQTEENT
jgi:alanyl-tRNA synthetase